MDAQRNFSPWSTLPSGIRLENLGFGTTLAGFAAAALATVVFAAVPAVLQEGYLAEWIEACTDVVTSAWPIAWPIANAALGAAG
jgi:hypothetical protein